jgi:tetratricopeptide (TPR) repeat protein
MANGTPRLHCAVYTRKSSEEGLDQAFNSLHAQRKACEAFVLSQRHEGWSIIDTQYADGGFSGGTMERPGLKALLDDISAGKVDVVVYKIDRLTRSLFDFAKIVETFDAHKVSFVSVIHIVSRILANMEAPPISDILRRILQGLNAALKNPRNADDRTRSYILKLQGDCFDRLKNLTAALRCYELALRLNPKVGAKRRALQIRKIVENAASGKDAPR